MIDITAHQRGMLLRFSGFAGHGFGNVQQLISRGTKCAHHTEASKDEIIRHSGGVSQELQHFTPARSCRMVISLLLVDFSPFSSHYEREQ